MFLESIKENSLNMLAESDVLYFEGRKNVKKNLKPFTDVQDVLFARFQ